MKICYWTPNAGGGAGKYEHYLPREIEKLGAETRIFRRPKGFKGNPLTLRLLYKSDGDIVHATSQTLSIYSYPKPRKFIVTVHDIYSLHRNLSSRIKRALIKKSLDRADKIISVSEFTKSEVESVGIDESKIEVVHMGVDISLYKPMEKEECRRKLGLSNEEKYILVVASNAPHKRMDITKKVFSEIRKSYDDIKLIKIGYGTRLEGEGIINLGFIPEEKMPILYNAADVLLHTSEYEGFGMPLLEAMACGTPIVASNKASISEVVGDCGYLVDLDTEDCVVRFAEKVLNVIESGERNLKGSKKSKDFTWEKVAKQTMDVYEKLLKT
ncbi:MAG: glycosyltransferase family 1 protein [Thermoprotei archaeon]|nr:MAG: glycosyltransferase family 1 protein [Thermoprotei archaeon]